jgi:pSer/pThr/pTyr-binding forkhead associated (FHA) protein
MEAAGQAIRITVTIGAAPPRVLDLPSPVLCGSGRAADLRITDPSVAPLHLRLARVGDAVHAIAVSPGVHVDGLALGLDEPLPVTGRGLTLGPARLVAAPWDAAPLADPTRTDSVARQLMRDLLGDQAPGPPELLVESGPAAGQRLVLPGVGAKVVIGRGDTGWVVLDPDLSRAHAVVEQRADGAWLCDLGSKNGTRLGQREVPTEAPGLILSDGDRITLGGTTLRFRDPAAAALGGATAMLMAETMTRDQAPPTTVAEPPLWPIVLAAVVAIAAGVVAVVLAL